MAEKADLQAISAGLRQERGRDKGVFVLGQEVGVYGGAFKVTLGLQEEFGPWRVIDMPLSETAILGGATGAAEDRGLGERQDRKSTRLNSSHQIISYAVFCFKKKI